jgi:hypothetical protein
MKLEDVLAYIYYLSLFACFCISIWAWYRQNKEAKTIAIYLFIAIITEIIVYLIIESPGEDTGKLRRLPYHIYIPIEYVILSLFFYKNNTSKPLRKAVFISIVVFLTVSALISYTDIAKTNPPYTAANEFPFPDLNYNIEGVLLIVFSVITLFSAEVDEQTVISKKLYFWICLGLMIYHTGVFIINPSYNDLIKIPIADTTLATVINNVLNVTMYFLFSIGLIKSTVWEQKKKS